MRPTQGLSRVGEIGVEGARIAFEDVHCQVDKGQYQASCRKSKQQRRVDAVVRDFARGSGELNVNGYHSP